MWAQLGYVTVRDVDNEFWALEKNCSRLEDAKCRRSGVGMAKESNLTCLRLPGKWLNDAGLP